MKNYSLIYLALTSILLIACKAENLPTEPETQEIEVDPITDIDAHYRTIASAKASEEPLLAGDDTVIERYLKNGLRLESTGKSQTFSVNCNSSGSPLCSNALRVIGGGWGSSSSNGSSSGSSSASSSSGSAQSSSSSGSTGGGNNSNNFSVTNVHVKGVGESDTVKYDGEHWFILTKGQGYGYYDENPKYGFQIVATDPSAIDAEVIGSYEAAGVTGLYLVRENDTTSNVAMIIEKNDGLFNLEVINVEDILNPVKSWDLSLEGQLVSSRRIDNTLYVVTQSRVANNIDVTLNKEPFNAEQKQVTRKANEELLSQLSANDLLPNYTLGNEVKPLTNDCKFVDTPEGTLGYTELVNLTSIDLVNKTVKSECIGGNIQVLSIAQKTAYVTGTFVAPERTHLNTVIHKFDLTEDGPQYAATGSVDGELSVNSDQAFKIHASDNDVRLVTSIDRVHQLFILEDNNGVLEQIAKLPNDHRPKAIGLPDEDIYSVRFDGDTAYVVTFGRARNTVFFYDPIYVIDLSDRLDPKITGDLELPGYATYMHPVGDRYIFTLGNDVDPSTGCIEGVKAELFDVSKAIPEIVDTHILGGRGANSIALDNLGAISFLQTEDDQLRVSFPVEYRNLSACRRVTGSTFTGSSSSSSGFVFSSNSSSSGGTSSSSSSSSSSSNSSSSSSGNSFTWASVIHMFEINNITSDQASLDNAGMMVTQSNENSDLTNPSWGDLRSILHDGAIFMTKSAGIWAAPWGTPEKIVGPILPQECSLEANPGVRLLLEREGEDNTQNLCDAVVTAQKTRSGGMETEILQPNRDGANQQNQCEFSGIYDDIGYFTLSAELPNHSIPPKRFVNIIKNYCQLTTVERTTTIESLESCQSNPKPTIVLFPYGPADADLDFCESTLTITVGDKVTVINAKPKSQVTDPEKFKTSLESDHLTCVLEGPPGLKGSVQYEINAPGAKTRASRATIQQQNNCRPNVITWTPYMRAL